MKVKDIIKKQTTIIAIAVVLVVVATIGVSYSVFFNVNKNTQNQVITAGTLKVTISGVTTALTLNNPMDNETGKTSETNRISYTVKNDKDTGNSNLPAQYSLYIYADSGNEIDLSKVKVFIEDDNTNYKEPKVLNGISDKITIAADDKETKAQNQTAYKIDSGTLAVGASSTTKNLHVWIDEDTLADTDNGKKVSLNLYVVSEVNETANP